MRYTKMVTCVARFVVIFLIIFVMISDIVVQDLKGTRYEFVYRKIVNDTKLDEHFWRTVLLLWI